MPQSIAVTGSCRGCLGMSRGRSATPRRCGGQARSYGELPLQTTAGDGTLSVGRLLRPCMGGLERQAPGSRDDEARILSVQTPTLRDVAEVAGVHAATASRALNPSTRRLVNAETARRVLRAAESLGYQPNPIARSLKTAKSGTIGLVIPDLTNPLFPPIVRGIEDVLGPSGYNAWIVNTDNDPERERVQIESLRSRQVEGLIVATARVEHPLLEKLREQGVRMVLVNRRIENAGIPSVTGDDSAGVARSEE